MSPDSPRKAPSTRQGLPSSVRRHCLCSSSIMAASMALMAAVASGQAAGCLDPTSATPYPGRNQPDFDIRAFSVRQGSTDQPLDRPLVISFTDRVATKSLNDNYFVLSREGGPAAPLELRQDLVKCSVTLAPTAPLQPGTLYELKASKEIESWSDVPLGKDHRVTFTTGNRVVGGPPHDTVTNEMVQQNVFDRHCGCCHDPRRGAYAHILSLEADSVVGLSSRQEPDRRLVVPGSQQESYLLHKILGLPGITGEPMPPPDLACNESWPRSRICSDSDIDLELVGDWIFDLGHKKAESTP